MAVIAASTEICRYPAPCFPFAPVTLVSVTGTLDLTDELMRLAHEDPYRFQKARFLTATREMRIRMAGRAHAEDVARSRADLPRRLEEIACDGGLSVVDRRAVIETLRAELDVATPEGRAQAERIRLFLEAWGPGEGGVPSCPGHERKGEPVFRAGATAPRDTYLAEERPETTAWIRTR